MLAKVSVLGVLTFSSLATLNAAQVGNILACYACQKTGNATVHAALAANPAVASDGRIFAFVNTSRSSITGGIFSLSNDSPKTLLSCPRLPPDQPLSLFRASHPTEVFITPVAFSEQRA